MRSRTLRQACRPMVMEVRVRKHPVLSRFFALRFESLEPRRVLDGGLLITELMAINNDTLDDENGESTDWIEIHNPTADPINLDGWYLT